MPCAVLCQIVCLNLVYFTFWSWTYCELKYLYHCLLGVMHFLCSVGEKKCADLLYVSE